MANIFAPLVALAAAALVSSTAPVSAMASVSASSNGQQQAPEHSASPDEGATSEGPSVDAGGKLDLMCFGGGSANKAAVANAWGWNNAGGYGSATVMGQRSQGFDDQVSLRIQNGEGRVRMPRTMLPPIHGGDDGWFKLKEIQIKPNEITASVAVNALNNPKLRLDRYSGAISISGKAGDYSGRCRRFDPQQAERQF